VHPGHMLRALMTKKKKKDLGSRFAPGPYFLLKCVRMPFFKSQYFDIFQSCFCKSKDKRRTEIRIYSVTDRCALESLTEKD